MKSLVIVVALLVTATCADVTYFGSNYVIPAQINNELQDTYILPATRYQSTYVAVPVSIVNTYIPTEPVKVSVNSALQPAQSVEVAQKEIISPLLQIRTSEVQLPPAISSVLEKSTQKLIQNTVQKIMQKTFTVSNIASKAEQLSSNTYLPPITNIKTPHAHLPLLIDTPPRYTPPIQEIVKTPTPTAPVQVKVNSAAVRLPELTPTSIATKTIEQTTLNIAPKPVQGTSSPQPVQVLQNSVTSPSSSQSKVQVISSTLTTKPSEVYVPVKINNSTPSKTIVQNTIQTPIMSSTESVKVTQKTDISAALRPVVTKVQPPKVINTSTPSVTIEKTVNFVPAPVEASQITGTSSILQKKLTDMKAADSYIPPETLLISLRNDFSSKLETETSAVKTVNSSIPPTPLASTLATKSAEVITTATPTKTIEKPVNIYIPPAIVPQKTDTSSTLVTKYPEVQLPKSINTSTPPKTSPTTVIVPPTSTEIVPLASVLQVLQGDVASSSPIKATVSKNIDIAAPLKTKSSDVIYVLNADLNPAVSTLNTKATDVKLVSTSVPTASVQATQSTNITSTIKTNLTEVQLPALIPIATPTKTITNTANDLTPPALVQLSPRIDISFAAQTSPKITENTVNTPSKPIQALQTPSPPATVKSPVSLWQLPRVVDIVQKTIKSSVNSNIALQTPSPPATVKSPVSLWQLPSVIDIVQKTIKSSVNSNIKPPLVAEPEIFKILPGLANGPDNYYLPPDDQNENYENVEVFTSEGYKTERRLKSTS